MTEELRRAVIASLQRNPEPIKAIINNIPLLVQSPGGDPADLLVIIAQATGEPS